MAFSAPAAYLTHQQKVLRLYKRALRHLESFCVHRWARARRAGGDSGEADGGRESPGSRRLKDFGDGGGRRPLGPADPGSRPRIAAPGLRDLEELLSGPGLGFLLRTQHSAGTVAGGPAPKAAVRPPALAEQ